MSRADAAPLRSRWDRTASGLVHARVDGPQAPVDGPTIVLVHGLVISSLYMVPTAVRLAPHLSVLAGPTMDPHARTAPRQTGRWLLDWTHEPPSLAAAHAVDYRRAGVRRAWRTFRHALADRVEEKLPSLTGPRRRARSSRAAVCT